MISRYRVSLDNVQLDSVDDRILIENVQYPDPGISNTINSIGGRNGGIVARQYRQKASVTVAFSVNAYDTAERQEVVQGILQWAKGHTLRVNDREGQHLSHVILEAFPAVNVREWTETMTMTFSGYIFPWWEDDDGVEVGFSAGTDETESITVPGNVDETYLTAEITAKTSVTWLKVITERTTIHLTGISLSSGNVVTIDYDDEMNLRIKKGTTSLLDKRTSDSSDDLRVPVGTSDVTIQASGNVEAEITARGCWY